MTILASAADVLRIYSNERPDLTVTDVCALLGLPKSNVSRLLRAMRDAGLLETVGDTKRYRPSILLHEAGRIFRVSSGLLRQADEVVKRVWSDTGHTGYVSRLDGVEVLAVTDHPGTRPLRVASSVGRRLAAFACATGRTLLARKSDDEVRALYPEALSAPSPTAPQSMDELLQRLARIRAEGYAESNDESVRGVGAIAAAVGDPETGEVVSLCISFPAATITSEERRAIARALVEGARSVAAKTGDPQFTKFPSILKD